MLAAFFVYFFLQLQVTLSLTHTEDLFLSFFLSLFLTLLLTNSLSLTHAHVSSKHLFSQVWKVFLFLLLHQETFWLNSFPRLKGTKTHLEGTKTHLEGTKTHSEGTKTHLEGTKLIRRELKSFFLYFHYPQ